MRKLCSKAWLISGNDSMNNLVDELTYDMDMGYGCSYSVERAGKELEDCDVILLETKFLESLDPSFYSKAVLILKKDEKPTDYPAFNRFIYNPKDMREFEGVFYLDDSPAAEKDDADEFTGGAYEFYFGENVYLYKGARIQFTELQREYLYNWLCKGYKNRHMHHVYDGLKRQFGATFLTNVDPHGQFRLDDTILEEKGSTSSDMMHYKNGDYDFDFRQSIYLYKGDRIHFTQAEESYLYNWLCLQYKDRDRNTLLYRMKERLGEDFLEGVKTNGGKSDVKYKGVWHKGGYMFDFTNEKYIWNNRTIKLEPTEKKYLYRWLCIGDKPKCTYTYIKRLRERYGDKFLRGIDTKGELKDA